MALNDGSKTAIYIAQMAQRSNGRMAQNFGFKMANYIALMAQLWNIIMAQQNTGLTTND
jgi:hypothetical protein